jgi:hypothetical protein
MSSFNHHLKWARRHLRTPRAACGMRVYRWQAAGHHLVGEKVETRESPTGPLWASMHAVLEAYHSRWARRHLRTPRAACGMSWLAKKLARWALCGAKKAARAASVGGAQATCDSLARWFQFHCRSSTI